MAYNKARAQKEWLKWKQAEEAKLRELGVDESTIQRLHIYDWSVFNSDRRFYEPLVDLGDQLQDLPDIPQELPVHNIASLLDSLEDERMFQALSHRDKLTLEILFLRWQGFSYKEIAKKVGVSEAAVRKKISRLKKYF